MQVGNRLFLLLLSIFFSATMAGYSQEIVQEKELKPITFGEKDTKYSYKQKNEKLIISAEGQNSASGLFVSNPSTCLEDNQLSWSWKVDQIQDSADITVKDKEDFAASLLVIFGKPGLFSRPKSIVYAFTNTDLPKNTVVESPRAPNNFRTIVLENEASSLMEWFQYSRNILEDYELAYGEMPKKKLFTIGVFTDNDQTEESVKAAYELESCNLTAQDFSEVTHLD